MTVYREIPDSEIAPDAPVLSDTAVALRDNIVSIFEGDGSAPKITPAAMLAPTAGAIIIWRSAISYSNILSFNSAETTAHVLIGGEIRITFDHVYSGDFLAGGIKLFKNTTEIYAITTSGASNSVDVTVSLGDVIYMKAVGDPGNFSIDNYVIKSGVATAAIA